MKSEKKLLYFGQDAIDSCPDGWTCAITGNTHMPDEAGYYVYIADEGCIEYGAEYGDHTLVCPVCGQQILGVEPYIEIECLDCSQTAHF